MTYACKGRISTRDQYGQFCKVQPTFSFCICHCSCHEPFFNALPVSEMLCISIMKIRNKILISILGVFLLGFLIPESREIPVEGATRSDWNENTFWYEPWGSSGVHKGVDIFAKNGTPVTASTDMVILYRGHISKGGKIIVGLGPKWRLHYFAHLENIKQDAGRFVGIGQQLGTVGDSGNARGKPPHLHFSIVSIVPVPWLIDGSTQGYKKAFYLNPIEYFQ